MVRRTLTALVLLGLLLPVVYLGGIAYFLLVAAFLAVASSEYTKMYEVRGFRSARLLVIGGVLLVLSARAYWPDLAGTVLALLYLLLMTFHILRFESGREAAAVDLAIDVGGIVYLGWIGAYLVELRQLPAGMWWLLLVLGTVWIADSAAYMVGIRLGRHKLARRASPNKSWEGYAGGVIIGSAGAAALGALFSRWGTLDVTSWESLGLGLLLSTVTTLGDLGESLIKRFARVKDSGSILPGHGGAFDRIDSLIWAGVIGYHCIRFALKP